MIALVAIAAFLLGWFASSRWSTRTVDHRWYCGTRHPAALSCHPTDAYLQREANRQKADDLEEQARHLRLR